jgi:hypothetical protein
VALFFEHRAFGGHAKERDVFHGDDHAVTSGLDVERKEP